MNCVCKAQKLFRALIFLLVQLSYHKESPHFRRYEKQICWKLQDGRGTQSDSGRILRERGTRFESETIKGREVAWDISVQTLHILSYTRLTLMRYVGNEIERCSSLGYWLPNSSELGLTGIRGLEKIGLSCLGPHRSYRYFPEDTAYSVLFRVMAPTSRCSLIKSLEQF
jgi:hypothetical protein